MTEMADPPYRKRTPSVGGVEIPPRRDTPDSLPVYDREVIALWLREVRDSQARVEQRLPAIESQLAEHAEELRILRESSTIAREVRQELREQGRLIGSLASDVRTVMRENAQQDLSLGKVEAAQIQAGAAKQARLTTAKWGVPGAVITIIIATAEQWGPALKELFGG
jgi:hypothetical protein